MNETEFLTRVTVILDAVERQADNWFETLDLDVETKRDGNVLNLVFDNGQDQWLIHGDAGLAVLLDEIAKAAKSQALHLITKRLRGSH